MNSKHHFRFVYPNRLIIWRALSCIFILLPIKGGAFCAYSFPKIEQFTAMMTGLEFRSLNYLRAKNAQNHLSKEDWTDAMNNFIESQVKKEKPKITNKGEISLSRWHFAQIKEDHSVLHNHLHRYWAWKTRDQLAYPSPHSWFLLAVVFCMAYTRNLVSLIFSYSKHTGQGRSFHQAQEVAISGCSIAIFNWMSQQSSIFFRLDRNKAQNK